jgi:hypothetical protein
VAGPTDQEQLLLEHTNEARLDPLANAARYISSYSTLTSPDAAIQSALRYFNVNGTALQSAFGALPPVQPLAWNENLAAGARGHSQGRSRPTYNRINCRVRPASAIAPRRPAMRAGRGSVKMSTLIPAPRSTPKPGSWSIGDRGRTGCRIPPGTALTS